MKFTAQSYRTTAAVLRESRDSELIAASEEFDAKAEQQEKVEQYGADLAHLARENNRYPNTVSGIYLVTKLLDDGWTPPKGLFDAE